MLPGNPPSFGNQLPNPGNVAWQQQYQQEAMAQHQEMLALQNHTLHPVAPYDDPINVDEVGHSQNGAPPPPPTNNIQAAMQGIDRARTAAAAQQLERHEEGEGDGEGNLRSGAGRGRGW